MSKYINSAIVIALAIIGIICIVNVLRFKDPLWAIAVGVVWIAITQRGRK